MCKAITHYSVIADINQEMRLQGIYNFVTTRVAFLTKTENNSGRKTSCLVFRGDNRIKTQRSLAECLTMVLNIACEIGAEVIQREFVEGYRFSEVFQIQHLILKTQ